MSETATPTGRTDRIAMLDTTRGIAVLGILLMNITAFGLPEAYDDPTNWGGATGANLIVWRTMALFFEGTMRGLFTLLFGAGALLFLERHASRDSGLRPADLYYRRTLWLIVFGLIDGYVLLWEGDILFHYGVTGLFLFVFRKLSVRTLLLVATVALSLPTVMNVIDRQEYVDIRAQAQFAQAKALSGELLSAEQQQAIEKFQQETEDHKPSRHQLEDSVARMRAGYISAFNFIKARTFYWETMFFLRYGFAECLGMMLLGMALLKQGVLSGSVATRTYLLLLCLGYAIGLTVNLWEISQIERSGFAVEAFKNAFVTYDLGRIPMTLGHVGLIGLLCRASILQRTKRTLASVGQMALTNYLTQSVICAILFTGAGFGLFGQLRRYELYYVVAAIWIVQLLWSPWWLRRFRFGPAEWLWRSLTYGKRQPMRLAKQPASESVATV